MRNSYRYWYDCFRLVWGWAYLTNQFTSFAKFLLLVSCRTCIHVTAFTPDGNQHKRNDHQKQNEARQKLKIAPTYTPYNLIGIMLISLDPVELLLSAQINICWNIFEQFNNSNTKYTYLFIYYIYVYRTGKFEWFSFEIYSVFICVLLHTKIFSACVAYDIHHKVLLLN